MKNVLLSVVLLAISTLQLAASNSVSSQSLDFLTNEKSVILDLSGLATEVEKFTITDHTGEVVFSRKVNNYESRVKFDLSKLFAGRYNFKVEGEDFFELHTALITDDQITIESVESYARPTIQELDNKIIVERVFSTEENIRVAIYNEAGTLVFESIDQKTGTYQKTFNLEQLEKGEYNVVVSTDHFSKFYSLSL